MSSAAKTDTFPAKSGSEPEQSKLWDYGLEFSRVPAWWDFTDPRSDSWNVYFMGGQLGESFLDSPDYDEIAFLITTEEDDYPDRSRGFDDFISRQYIESAFLENGDREAVGEVARALEEPRQTDLWEEVGDGRVPLKAEFDYGGTNFRVEKDYDRQDFDGWLYPVPDYLARERRPGAGEQVGLRALRQNIRDEDVGPLETIVQQLKEAGATVYLTGSVLETPGYDDIDIAVDGLHWPRETFRNRTEGGSYPQRGAEYGGLPRHLSFDQDELAWTLEDVPGLESVEPVEEPERGSDLAVSHGYNAVGLLYSFSLDGTEFDIGYDEEPFISRGFDPLDTDDETLFAKI